MKTTKPRDASFDVKKWGFFFLFLVVLVIGFYFVLQPADEKRAMQSIARAEALTRQAEEIARGTNTARDLANYDLAREALEKAKKFSIENELSAALNEAQKSATYAQKVIDANAGGNLVRSGNRFTEIVGEVLVRSGGNFQTADQDTVLGVGTLIKTTARGSGCRIAFDNGMEVLVSSGTDLILLETIDRSDDVYRITLELERGSIDLITAETGPGRVNVIASPGSALFNRGTRGSVSLSDDSDPALEVRVLIGRADVRSGVQSLPLGPNNMVTFTADLFRSTATDLIPSPLLSAPPPFSKFAPNESGFASVALSWEPADGAIGYNVQVSTDSLFVNIHEDRLGVISERVEMPALRPGIYFWRVRALSPSNIAGFPTDTQQFEVTAEGGATAIASEGKPPTLEIIRIYVQGYVAILKGRTERDATVKVNNERAIMNKDDGTFTHTLTFAGKGTYKVIIVAESSTGGLTIEETEVTIED